MIFTTHQSPFLASPNSKHPVALTIGGSGPGGGAGLQADLKTFAALGVYGYSVITEVIAQNSFRVADVENVSPEMVEAQLNTLALECVPRAIKTGALANAAIVKAVARAIERLKLPAPVVDPVIVSSSGALLIGPKGERAIRKRLIPLARIVTPNIAEAEVLSRLRIDSGAAIREAAIKIVKLGARAVVIKGGHRKDNRFATDLFYDGRRFIELKSPRKPGAGAHGTGCAFSAAIPAHLARAASPPAPHPRPKRYSHAPPNQTFKLGKGRALLDHFARG